MNELNTAASDASVARLRSAFSSTPIDPGAIKNAVCAYVDDMKKLNAPIERIIVDVKRTAMVENSPLHRAVIQGDAGGRRLVEDAVTWCIERFYGTGA